MSNIKLVYFTRISPNSSARTAKIDSIIIHHMASTALNIERCGAEFARKERKASSNYGVGSDGRIGLYVDESRRAWTSSNWQADNRAVTIEVQNSTKGPNWEVSDAALAATIDLCADICRRNGIPRLNYTGDKKGNLLMHKWFAATGCPGPYLGGKFPYIAAEVNRRLGATDTNAGSKQETAAPSGALAVGDTITLTADANYTTGKAVPAWVRKKTLYVRNVTVENITFSIYKTGAITGIVNRKYVSGGSTAPTATTLAVGDKITLATDANYTTGKAVPAWVRNMTLYVRKVSGDNITFSIYKTGAVTGVVNRKYVKK